MEFKNTNDGNCDLRFLLKEGMPLSRFCLGRTEFRLSAAEEDGVHRVQNLPVSRDDVWQYMLHIVPFDEWLQERRMKMDSAGRDARGIFLMPGTPILVPDPQHESIFYKDTPANRDALLPVYEAEKAEIEKEIDRLKREYEARAHAAEQERQQRESEKVKADEKRLRDSVKTIVDESLDRLIPPDAEMIQKGLLEICPDLKCPSREWIIGVMHELAEQCPDKYKVVTSLGGKSEEIQKVFKG